MANEYRRPLDEFFGTISAGITALETTLQSEQFARLDDGYDTARYLPLVLADDTTQVIEVVYVRAHAAGSNTVTVLRGQEGTTARQWPVGTTFRAAPTTRDGVQSLTAAQITALTNPHVGMDVVDRDAGLAMRRTLAQGFLPAGASFRRPLVASDAYDRTIAADRVPILMAGHCAQKTQAGTGNATLSPSQGGVFFDMGAPLPGDIIAVLTTKLFANTSDPAFAKADLWGVERNATNWRLWFACVNGSNGLLANGLNVNFSVLVVGY